MIPVSGSWRKVRITVELDSDFAGFDYSNMSELITKKVNEIQTSPGSKLFKLHSFKMEDIEKD